MLFMTRSTGRPSCVPLCEVDPAHDGRVLVDAAATATATSVDQALRSESSCCGKASTFSRAIDAPLLAHAQQAVMLEDVVELIEVLRHGLELVALLSLTTAA